MPGLTQGVDDATSLTNAPSFRIHPAVHCCCGCCRPLARAVKVMCMLVILHTVYIVSQYVIRTATSEEPDEGKSIWAAVLSTLHLTSRAVDVMACMTGLQSVNTRNIEKANMFYTLMGLSVLLKTGYGTMYIVTADAICKEQVQIRNCVSDREASGVWSVVVALSLYGYLTYIAWSFRMRLEDGSAYLIMGGPSSGVWGVAAQRPRPLEALVGGQSFMLTDRDRPPEQLLISGSNPPVFYVAIAKTDSDDRFLDTEPVLGIRVDEGVQRPVLGQVAWPLPVTHGGQGEDSLLSFVPQEGRVLEMRLDSDESDEDRSYDSSTRERATGVVLRMEIHDLESGRIRGSVYG